MEQSQNNFPPLFQALWLLSTGIAAVVSNLITDIDIILALITKAISIISFVFFVILHHEKLISNFKKLKKRFK